MSKHRPYLVMKRLGDILVGACGSFFALPTLGIVKIIYLAHKDQHPILLKQPRIGKNGHEFTMYKIRTMVIDADVILAEILAHDKSLREEYQRNKKFQNDPRITKAGGIIRRYSIDEIPQFFNILCGQMSLIGNRPYLPRERDDMGDAFHTVVATKPGLISYWAVNGRNNLDFNSRLRLEKHYSNNVSFGIDFKIALSAIPTVIRGKGAK